MMAIMIRAFLIMTILGGMFGGPTEVRCGAVFNRVIKTGTLRLGHFNNRPPWGFLKPTEEWAGFEVDLARGVAKHLNLKLETLRVNEATWGSMLSSGQIDAALCRIQPNRSLVRNFDFSVPYFFDSLQVLTVKGPFKTVADLAGKKIAVVHGSPCEKPVIAILKQAGDDKAEQDVVPYPDAPTCFMAVGQEKVAGWLDSGMTLLEYSSQSPRRFERITASDVVGEVAVAVPKNDSAFRSLINSAIQDMVADGSFTKVFDKWFGPETPYSFPLISPINIWPD